MSTIEPIRKDVQHPAQVKKYSASLRLWHWANTIVISGSLITVLINSTLTDDHSTSSFMKDELNKAGATVTADQAKSVAHALSDKTWDVHIYFGYALAALLLFRLILEFFQLADQKFIRKLKSAWYQFQTTKQNREAARHELTVKAIYSVFYLLVFIMVATGLFLAFEDALAAFKSIRHTVKSIHGFCMYLILAFIAAHLAGVFLAERKESKGIVSDMINGGGQ
ncbi:cytochrome b/b6 domain-containing protein [Mucilaginibacter agri]|uniref:Cytochrome b/b6 domain-containing protein n=1 Tax=Mucilaginibacter agri TaxID=2695265 RepID=A0A965ZMZ0_9SPHI|nr:cytochrome b/b6 domain-containing protein [Mucilaginibacter agri]NCD72546.1 cytochrome b/b6 domain-containing protein [Mucilaginibacter agri]